MAASLSADSFEKLGLHPNVCVALSAKGINGPYPQQAATLMNTARDMCDVLATVQPHSGRHTLLISFAAHCVLSAIVPKFSLIIASSASAATKLCNVTKMFGIVGVTPHLAIDGNTNSDKACTSGCVSPSIVITTLPNVIKWQREFFLKCATLLVEDVSTCLPAVELEQVMHTVSSSSDAMNMFLLTTQLPNDVPVSVRYGLHRRRRRFCPPAPAPPSFTFLLATDHDDRLTLLRKLVQQVKPLRRIVVFTHSKEVKDLRMKLQQWGLNTFALGRNAAAAEQKTTINEFISATYGVLVTSDAFAGVDLLDVDGVVQYYPPQKSMDEEEWSDYIRCIQTTANPITPTRFITLLGTDDFTLGAYFMKRAECEGLIMNVNPNHARFADIVLNPLSAAMERVGQSLPGHIDVPKGGNNGGKGGGGGGNNNNNNNGKSNNGNNNNNNNGKQSNNNNNNNNNNNGKNNGNNNNGKKEDTKTDTNATSATGDATDGAAAEGQQPCSNRAKRRQAQDDAARRKQQQQQEAAAKDKEREAQRQRERERDRQRERERQKNLALERERAAAAAANSAASAGTQDGSGGAANNTTDNSADNNNSNTKSKRQQRRDVYHAEARQQRSAQQQQ